MKTKRSIYFLLIVLGAAILGFGDYLMRKEYALCIGIVFLMFGIYKSTQVWTADAPANTENIENTEDNQLDKHQD